MMNNHPDKYINTLPVVDRPLTTWSRQRQPMHNDWFQVKDKALPEDISEDVPAFDATPRSIRSNTPDEDVEHVLKTRARQVPYSQNNVHLPLDTKSQRRVGWLTDEQNMPSCDIKRVSMHSHAKTFPIWGVPVPKLNFPPDLEGGLGDSPRDQSGYRATPSSPECTDRSDSYRFGVRPREVLDPVQELHGFQRVPEKKYSILPAIGTPRDELGQADNWNQLDYLRDQCEYDAEVITDCNQNVKSPDVLAQVFWPPLPPIRYRPECWNSSGRGEVTAEHGVGNHEEPVATTTP